RRQRERLLTSHGLANTSRMVQALASSYSPPRAGEGSGVGCSTCLTGGDSGATMAAPHGPVGGDALKVSLRVGFRRDDPVSPLDGVLRDCREMGFDGIELMLSPSYPFGPTGRRGGGRGPWSSESVTPALREQLRASAERHG